MSQLPDYPDILHACASALALEAWEETEEATKWGDTLPILINSETDNLWYGEKAVSFLQTLVDKNNG